MVEHYQHLRKISRSSTKPCTKRDCLVQVNIQIGQAELPAAANGRARITKFFSGSTSTISPDPVKVASSPLAGTASASRHETGC